MNTSRSAWARQQDKPAVWIRSWEGSIRLVPLSRLHLHHFEKSVSWRKLRSLHGQRHLPGSYWAVTTGGHVVYESRLELARLLLADFDPDVTAIYAQPCRLAALVGGRHVHLTPEIEAAPGGPANDQ